MRKYKCSICGYIYDESTGAKWEDLPDDYVCPMCGAPKSVFNLIEESAPKTTTENTTGKSFNADKTDELLGLSCEEISAICSSLAKGCEKQRLAPEMEAFAKIADYYKTKAGVKKGKTLKDAAQLLNDDFATGFNAANTAAKANADRGAQRSLVWSEKVSTMLKVLLERFDKEGTAMLENTNIYVCDICGFIYLGDAPPDICPVCKVPHHKILQVGR